MGIYIIQEFVIFDLRVTMLMLILFFVISGVGADFLQSVNYRAIVNSVIDLDGTKYSVTSQRFNCANQSTSKFSAVFISDPEQRCSCFGNCTLPVDCYSIVERRIGASKLIIGTSLQNVKNTTYTVNELEKLYIFEPPLDYKYSDNDVSVYCFSDKEYGAVIADASFRYLYSRQKFTFSYFKDRVIVNYVSRNYMFETIRDQFVPDVNLNLGQDFVYSCFNVTQKFNRFPPYECSKPFISSSNYFRCTSYYKYNNCPDEYLVNLGADIVSTIVLPYVSYDGEHVTPDYLNNKFIPNYMNGLKGIFPDVFGWLSDELNKLIRGLGNLFLDSLGYILNRIVAQIYSMLPLIESFVTMIIKTFRFLFIALVKIVVKVEKQIFLSEYLMLYLFVAYYMNLELAPVIFVVIAILVLGITRWFPSILLFLLNGEFRTELSIV